MPRWPMIWLALRMLVGDPSKFLGVVLGIFLSTFLILHLLGMFNGMMQRTYALISDIPLADVWVMDPTVEYVDEPSPLPDTALQRVRAVDGVEWATPLITTGMRARLPGGVARSVLVVGIDDATFVGAPPALAEGRIEQLRELDAIAVDSISAHSLLKTPIHPRAHPTPDTSSPHDAPTRNLALGDELYINDHRLIVVAIAQLGPRFLSRPVVFMPISRARFVTPPQRNLLSYVLVKARPSVSPEDLASRINLATGLRARSAKQFSDDTYWYFVNTTGVVDRIAFMVIIGLVVGVSVSALLLYLFTIENAHFYALLIAMGTQGRTISLMVAVQALTCGSFGYALGLGASCLLAMLTPQSSMPYLLTNWAIAACAFVTLFICALAGVLSLRRVLSIEPAMAFQH